ncbi:23S rRNA (uracil(1939)-C(5))-methyltransferase RlmD [uncultured Allofournierella sp.]|uniref:23S rRNA (uracil(1939)-C(5))-methyltransferase RlmD n=1 Tax=uncultured Allofournierella sp. TaxID=1940258 RepID=UPI0025E13B5D|nr:23S rRNA (uracil(1939)-C(5))-methyltransferase RlmD [uncultured Fournierella sp.]
MKNTCSCRKKGCGGCPLLALPYPEQLAKKQKDVEKLLGKFGPVQPILGMEDPWHYRNKAVSTFCAGPGRSLQSGIYAQGTHRVIPVEECLLHNPALDEAIAAVRTAAAACRYEPFNEDRRTGLIRHVLVRHSRATGQVLVCLVTAQAALPGSKAFVTKLRQLCPSVSTVVQNINPRHSSAVLGSAEKLLYGKGYIEDTLCGVTFRLSAASFYQVNPVQTERLYQTAIEAAGLDGSQTVLDAYCGVGTIGLASAVKAKSVLGVELNRSAVNCAIQNAKANGITNARFLCADATSAIQRMAQQGERMDVVFLDPPRAGSTPEFLQAVCQLAPDRVVYISCNPETQRRDLEYLTARGWKASFIQPVDLFPHTEHVETIVLLQRETL